MLLPGAAGRIGRGTIQSAGGAVGGDRLIHRAVEDFLALAGSVWVRGGVARSWWIALRCIAPDGVMRALRVEMS